MPISEARELANERELDLLLVTENTTPPVCKIINIGEYKYHQKKKEKNNKTTNIIKELKMRPSISTNDFKVRVEKAKGFLKKKFKVKLTVFFKGREIVHQDLGHKILEKFIEETKEYGVKIDNTNKKGRFLITIINPK